MTTVLLIILAVLPAALIGLFVYKQDRYEREEVLPLIVCFCLGMLITAPALWIEQWADAAGWRESESLLMTLVVAFIVVAYNEELFKFLALWLFPYRRPFFDEPFDGIVYSVMIGLGFATLENVLYAWNYGLEITILRAFTAVPAHGVFAIVMGYFAGLARFKKVRKHRIRLLLQGLLFATLLHGAYDFFILQQSQDWLMIFSIILLYASMYFAWQLIQNHQENSPFKHPHLPEADSLLTDLPIDSQLNSDETFTEDEVSQ